MASIARRPDGTYRPRFRDASGKEHARHFKRKVDAQRWLDEMTAAMVTGQYVDPAAGRVTFRDYAERWRATQVHRPTTAAHVETMLRRHVYPTLGDRPLSSILPSDVQSLVKRLSATLAPSTVGVVHRILAGIFKAAVHDRRIVDARFTITGPSETNGFVNALPMLHHRYFPSIEEGADPSMDELVTMKSYDWEGSDIWTGEAEVRFFDSPVEELESLAPVEMIGGYFRSVGVSWGIGTRLA